MPATISHAASNSSSTPAVVTGRVTATKPNASDDNAYSASHPFEIDTSRRNNASTLVTPSASAITPNAQASAIAVFPGHRNAPRPNSTAITPYITSNHQLRPRPAITVLMSTSV